MPDNNKVLASNAEPIIQCKDVNKWFGEFHVLRDITVDVGLQEVVVVIGPSGSGKSTFIRCINRLEEHQSGDIIVDGIELGNDVRNIAAIRREIGMVFQQFNLFPHKTVQENITLARMKVRGWSRSKADATVKVQPESTTSSTNKTGPAGTAPTIAKTPSRL